MKAHSISAQDSLARQLKILAEPNRLRILELIFQGVHCNCEFGEALQLPPNLISHHLGVLRQAGLLDVERNPDDARWLYYTINRPALEALYRAFAGFFDPQRIQPRRSTCGPSKAKIDPTQIHLAEVD